MYLVLFTFKSSMGKSSKGGTDELNIIQVIIYRDSCSLYVGSVFDLSIPSINSHLY